MLQTVAELLADKLSADIWAMIMLGIVVLAFIVTLVIGLAAGEFKQVKGVMKSCVAKPSAAIAALKKLPPALKSQYKAARMGNIKPSSMVTKTACVDEPYTHSVISKLWVVTFVATVICGVLSYFVMPFASEGGEFDLVVAPALTFIGGGLFTLIGAIIGRLSYSGAVKLYGKFMPVLDGDTRDTAGVTQSYSEPQQAEAYAAQPAYEAQAPQNDYEAQPAYEAQPVYEQPQATYAEPVVQPVANDTAESDADFRKRAREEALAQARAQQAQAAQAQARAQQQPQQQAQPQAGGSSSADEVIARINQIERDGATREAMRDVATQLQKERSKPENKSPERMRQLNDALSRLLKAMSGAKK